MTVNRMYNIGGGIGLRRRGKAGSLQTIITTTAAGIGTEQGFYYDRLMQVVINNTFYNTNSSRSPDFVIGPTRNTERIMKSLGLLVRDEGGGFSVLYDTSRVDGLLRYLRQHAPSLRLARDEGAATRLAFTLTLRNPDFCYFTDIPFDIDASRACYYVNNCMAHVEDGRVILNPFDFVPQSVPLPAVDGQFDVPYPPGCTAIEVFDVLGNAVQCYPRDIPVVLLALDATAVASCGKVAAFMAAFPHAPTESRDICTVNFYLLPAGCYSIRYVGTDKPPQSVIYRAEDYRALCFVDLFMADPHEGGPGIFPIEHLYEPKQTSIHTVGYDLNFAARSTFWEYFIVPPSQDAELRDLRISRRNGEPVPFTAAEREPIGLDTVAYRSVSEVPLRLQTSSDYDFKLTGRIQDGKGMITRDTTLMPRLPVAPRDWALPLDDPSAPAAEDSGPPAPAPPTYGKSAIYVYL